MLNSPVGNHVHVGVSMVKHNERVHDMKTLISHTIQPHGLHKHSSFVLDDALSLFPTMNTGIWCQTTEILSQHWKTAINVLENCHQCYSSSYTFQQLPLMDRFQIKGFNTYFLVSKVFAFVIFYGNNLCNNLE